MEKNMSFWEITTAVKKELLPVTRNTIYKWHALKKYPALIIKVGGKLFWDNTEWLKMCDQAKQQQIHEAERVRA